MHNINLYSSASAGVRSCNLQHVRQPPCLCGHLGYKTMSFKPCEHVYFIFWQLTAVCWQLTCSEWCISFLDSWQQFVDSWQALIKCILFVFLSCTVVVPYMAHRNCNILFNFTIALSSYWHRVPESKGILPFSNATKYFLSSRQASNK